MNFTASLKSKLNIWISSADTSVTLPFVSAAVNEKCIIQQVDSNKGHILEPILYLEVDGNGIQSSIWQKKVWVLQNSRFLIK